MKDARAKSGPGPTDPAQARRSMAFSLFGTALVVLLSVLAGSLWAPGWLQLAQPALLVLTLLLIYVCWRMHRRVLGAVVAQVTPGRDVHSFHDNSHDPLALGTFVNAERDKVVSRMATGMVHEFNNSLQVVVACAAHLQANARLDPDGRALCREIIDTCSDTSQLARQLLSLGERIVVEKHVLDAGQELALLHRNVRRILPANISVQAEPCQEQLLVQVDPVHLRHTLLKLCMVLGDAMPDGGSLRLRVGLLEPRRVEFVVEGSGTELSRLEDEATKSFGLAYEADADDAGYAAARAFAQQYQGEASVGPSSGGGVQYKLALSRRADAAATEQENPSISLENRRFLVVDDDWRARQAIKKTLTDARGDVVLASSVQEALDCLEHEDVDVVCADAIMPGQPTRLLLETLLQNFPQTKILVCSAYSEGELSRRGIELRRFAHLNKPFAPEQLVTLVQELLASGPSVH